MSGIRERLRFACEWPIRTLTTSLLSHPLWGHFIPFIPNGTRSWYIFPQPFVPEGGSGLPIPPRELWRDLVGSEGEFLESGRADTRALAAAVRPHLPQDADSVLDFGCGAGRMTRWMKEELGFAQVLGTDLDSTRASWCVNNLGGYGRFWTSTSHPHLPLRDASIDLVVCGSVFTHIDDLSEAWLMELARIIRPQGLLYVTIHDEAAIAWLNAHHPGAWLLRKLRSHRQGSVHVEKMARKVVVGRFNRSQVFYQRSYFIDSISRDFTHVETIERGFGFQTALVFRRF